MRQCGEHVGRAKTVFGHFEMAITKRGRPNGAALGINYNPDMLHGFVFE